MHPLCVYTGAGGRRLGYRQYVQGDTFVMEQPAPTPAPTLKPTAAPSTSGGSDGSAPATYSVQSTIELQGSTSAEFGTGPQMALAATIAQILNVASNTVSIISVTDLPDARKLSIPASPVDVAALPFTTLLLASVAVMR